MFKSPVKFLSFALILAGCLLFSSCNDTPSTPEIVVIGETTSTMQSMMTYEDEYEAKRNVDVAFKPNTFDDAFAKSTQDFVNGTGLYDIVIQYNFTLSSCVRNNYVLFTEDLVKGVSPDSLQFEDDIFPDLWQELGYYSEKDSEPAISVGYPSAGLTMLLMYNQDMFGDESNKARFQEKYGHELTPPTTWDEFRLQAEFFTNVDRNQYGVCLQGGTGGFLYYEWMNFLGGFGGKVMDKDHGWQGNLSTDVLLNSPEAIQAVEYQKSLKPYNAGNFTSVEQFEQMRIMKEGNVALALVWSDMIYPSLHGENGMDPRFGFAPVPGEKSILGGGVFFVNRDSNEPKESARLVIDLLQPDTQVQLARIGLCSPLSSVYQDSIVRQLPYTDALHSSLARGGIGLEAGPDAGLISDVITTYCQRVWNDELSAEDAMNQAQIEVVNGRAEIFVE